MKNVFETVSFHIVKPCNMKCKFCYATFEDLTNVKQLSLENAKIIVKKLKDAGVQKITFAGGEPLLYKYIKEIISYSKKIGLTTSIITNGLLLSVDLLKELQGKLDWIGLSVDSVDYETNQKIGRFQRKQQTKYYALVHNIKVFGYRLKINTVVNKFNQDENFVKFIEYANPERWKVFDTLRVEGQNDKEFEEIKSTQFEQYVKRNKHSTMVVENNEKMTGSYLLIDPFGRLFENTQGKHSYSRNLIDNNIIDCLSDINLNRDMFIERGGIYNW